MINFILIFIFLLSNAWSKVNLELVLNTPSVKQGEIAVGRLVVKQAEGQAGLSGLKGKNIGKTVYLLNVEPFMGKQGQLESEAKVIFFVVPQATSLSEVINGEEVVINWNNIEVIPTETSKSFLFGDFEIPERTKILKWILLLLGFSIIMGSGFWLRNYLKKKTHSAKKLKLLKAELVNCSSYDEIVLMWRQKRHYIEVFPKIEIPFKNFEDVLFKYQFKSHRTEQEIEEVTSAYQQFKTSVLGVLNEI